MEIKIKIECVEKDPNYPKVKVTVESDFDKFYTGGEETFDGNFLDIREEIKAWLLLKISNIDIDEIINDYFK